MDIILAFKVTIALLLILEISFRQFIKIKSNKIKPFVTFLSFKYLLNQFAVIIVISLIIIQLTGFTVLLITENLLVLQVAGMVLVILGVSINLLARRELSTNWTPGYQYQIKKHHELITNGIYKSVRHPIYLGHVLFCVGTEMVVQSYLSILFFFVLFIWAYIQAKSEETLLLRHFGKKYKTYMASSKMFIPFIL